LLFVMLVPQFEIQPFVLGLAVPFTQVSISPTCSSDMLVTYYVFVVDIRPGAELVGSAALAPYVTA
jgi:hypothetical protein